MSVGGGGLISGIATYLKHKRPDVKVKTYLLAKIRHEYSLNG